LKKQHIACLSLLALMLTFAYAVPQSFCQVDSSSSNNSYSDWNNGSTYQYQTYPTAITQAYSGGFLVNTVFELRNAYDLNPLYAEGYDGSGQTVVIVDAYGSPTIYQDLLLFIQWQNNYGANLPWTSMAAVKSHLHIYYPFGEPVLTHPIQTR